jgi:zinc transport system ATP-binding protein
MTEPLLSLDSIRLQRDSRTILDGVSLRIRAGEIHTVIGPNGAGKTSLVRVALGLLPADAGLRRVRPGLRIGYMPQRLDINPALPLTVQRFLQLARSGLDSEDLAKALAEVGAHSLAKTAVSKLSGGELQRVLLARALLRQPELLVLDEPAQGVDITGQEELYTLITRVRDQRGLGVLMVSHDLHLVMAATDHVLCLNQHVCCEGHPESVSAHPEYQRLFGIQGSKGLAVYSHHHDHHHDTHGSVCTHKGPHEHV